MLHEAPWEFFGNQPLFVHMLVTVHGFGSMLSMWAECKRPQGQHRGAQAATSDEYAQAHH